MDYTSSIAAARDLITSFGTTVTVRRRSAGTHDPVEDTVTSATTSTMTVAAVILPLTSGGEKERDDTIDDGEIRVRRKVLMPAVMTNGQPLSFTPQPSDVLVFGTLGSPNEAWWSVVSVAPLEPDGTDIMYSLVVRRGMPAAA